MSRSRVMIVGTNSGCGKTTVTCAIMKALMNQGLKVAPFKCGPDYIDPMFHKHITGQPSINLDLFFLEKDRLNWLLNSHLQDSDIGIIEGVMGMYDGIGTTAKASSFDVAVSTNTPMVLVVNARGMSVSLAAMIKGYKDYGGSDLVKGVILNNVGKGTYMFLKKTIEEQTGVSVLGYFEKQEKAVIESRHLGLITAQEIQDLDEKVEILAQAAEKSIDFKALKAIADSADEGASYQPERMPFEAAIEGAAAGTKVKLAVAMDKAFCFYYEDNLNLLKKIGVEILPFSPLHGDEVPKEADGIYLGGGYPEVYAGELSKKLWPKLSIRHCYSMHMPILAECGGFMYLHENIEDLEGHTYQMVGLIPGTAKLTKKLGPFGYVDITPKKDSMLGEAGAVIKGHEFHYSVSDNAGSDFTVSKTGGKSWEEGHAGDYLYGGYPHLYLYSRIESALSFKKAMIKYHKRSLE